MSLLRPWLIASRPKTLPAAILPVLMGAALAWRSAPIDWFVFACIVLSAMAIQIGTNFANDYADFKSGADRERRGPLRVTQAGLLTPESVKLGAHIAFSIAVLFGAPLIWKGGLPIALIGFSGILFGWLYTSGPYPLGYNGLGELFVLLYFGFAAVMGTHYLLTGLWTSESALLSLIPGLHASALLAANNLRDLESDRAARKHTLAARFGRKFARLEYAALLLIPYLVPVVMHLRFGYNAWVMTPLLSIQGALNPLTIAFKSEDADALQQAFLGTARILVVFGGLTVFCLITT